jgi:uncharacterized protein (TIGR02246 family)
MPIVGIALRSWGATYSNRGHERVMGARNGCAATTGIVHPLEWEVIMRRLLLVATICAAGTAPALAQDKATIQKLNDKFVAAFNKGDAAAIAAMYTNDAAVLPPGSEIVKGKNAIQAFWKKSAEQLGDIKLITVDVKPLGNNAAREIGTVTLKTKAQPPQDVSGKYVVVWNKTGREWKLDTDIWNTN